jgi:hypothetical protein
VNPYGTPDGELAVGVKGCWRSSVSLTLALTSLFHPPARERVVAVSWAEEREGPAGPAGLGGWLALAAAAGVAAVPAQRLGDIATDDLIALSGVPGDPVSPEGEAAVEHLAAMLQDAPAGTILRWDVGCLGATRRAVLAGRRPAGPDRGYTVFGGRVMPCFRDRRLAGKALLWRRPRVTAWLRPWVEARRIAGERHAVPEIWRIHLGHDGGAAASLVHPGASIAAARLGDTGCSAALASAALLADRMRGEGRLADRGGGLLHALDFLIDGDGHALLLDGGVVSLGLTIGGTTPPLHAIAPKNPAAVA